MQIETKNAKSAIFIVTTNERNQMANHKYRRDTDRAFAHAIGHLENAKQDINLCENIIRKAQEDSHKAKRKNDKNN